MSGAFIVGVLFAGLGVVMIRFRNQVSRFRTDLNQSAFPFLPDLFTRVTPGGVVLGAVVCFFIALLALVGGIIEASAP